MSLTVNENIEFSNIPTRPDSSGKKESKDETFPLATARFSKDYPIPTVETVSTVGAGDNFNAGIIYGLLKLDIRYDDLNDLDEARWNRVMDYGIAFATESCRSLNNSISPEFAEKLKIEKEA